MEGDVILKQPLIAECLAFCHFRKIGIGAVGN